MNEALKRYENDAEIARNYAERKKVAGDHLAEFAKIYVKDHPGASLAEVHAAFAKQWPTLAEDYARGVDHGAAA